jgi:proline iminopeptidase
MKIAIIVGVVVIGFLLAVGIYFWYQMQQPLYKPGMVRAGKNLRASLNPPEQSGGADFWQVENDIQLYHFSAGAGRNVLIVHGGPGYPYRQSWTGLEPLTSRYQFHYYDQRGCGHSTRPIDTFESGNYFQNVKMLDKTLGLGAQIADIERIRQILGEEKIILIGHSWGAFLTALYAAEFPENVEAVIFVAPAPMLIFPMDDDGLFEQVKQKLPEDMQAEYDDYLVRYFDFRNIFANSEADLIALSNEFVKYYAAAEENYDTPLPEPDEAGGWMVWAGYFGMGQRHDYTDALKNVNVPVLILHGQNDMQSEAASRSYEVFPNSTFQVIENATHFPFEERPEAFATVVSEFLGKTTNP